MKKFWSIFLICIIGLFVLNIATIKIMSTSNAKHNTKVLAQMEEEYLIENQHNYSDLKYGFGNISKNGCGPVAVYNLLKYYGNEISFERVIFDLEKAQLCYGLLGTNPFKLNGFLKQIGFETKLYTNKNEFDIKASQSECAIFCYWNFNGGHYTLLTDFNKLDNTYILHNPNRKATMQNLTDAIAKNCNQILICIK